MEILFDSYNRINSNFASYTTPHYKFLNESAQKKPTDLRKIFKSWFSFYPRSNSKEFIQRFRSENNQDHISAFFELFIFTLFRHLGSKIEVHPILDYKIATRPDFGVELNSMKIIIECCVSGDPNIEENIQSHFNIICDKLNSIKSNYFFSVIPIKSNPSPPSYGRLIRYIQNKVKSLNNCVIKVEDKVKWIYETKGWKIEIQPVSKNKYVKSSRNVMISCSPVILIDSKKKLLHALKNKRPGKYGNFKLPYIIAINSLDVFLSFDEFEEIIFDRKNDIILRKTKFINQRISAFLFCERLNPFNYNKAKFRLLVNPWAKYSIPQEIISFAQSRYLIDGLEIKKRIDIYEENQCFDNVK